MHALRHWFAPIAAALLLAAQASLAGATTGDPQAAQALLTEVAESLLAAMRAEDFRKDEAGIQDLVDRVLLPHVDFGRASRLVLGKHWRTATPEQRVRFEAEFRGFVIRFYTTALAEWLKTNEVPTAPVQIGQVHGHPGDVVVEVPSKFKRPDGSEVDVGYRVYWVGDAWKVIDVSVGGISMVTNYRASFASEIAQIGLDGLIARLAERNGGTAPRRTQPQAVGNRRRERASSSGSAVPNIHSAAGSGTAVTASRRSESPPWSSTSCRPSNSGSSTLPKSPLMLAATNSV